MRERLSLRSERGASLVMVTIFLPVLIAFLAFVVDAGNAFAVKRATQNAADAAALAAAQDLEGILLLCGSDLSCYQANDDDVPPSPYRQAVAETASRYSHENGSAEALSELPQCKDVPPEDLQNCYTWPFDPEGDPADSAVQNYLRVEVILQNEAETFFATIAPVFGMDVPEFLPGARAVASAQARFETTCDLAPGPVPDPCRVVVDEDCDYTNPSELGDHSCPFESEIPPQQGFLDVGEGSHCIFAENEDEDPGNDIEDPDQYLGSDPPCTIVEFGEGGGVEGAQGFAMSRACEGPSGRNAIWYTGTPTTGGSGETPPDWLLGAFGTNGGLLFEGSKQKWLETLGFDKARCGYLLPEPPNNDPVACEAAVQAKDASCVKQLVDFGDRIPMNWPVTPPLPPAPLAPGTTWDPAVHYPRFCTLLSPPPGGNTVTLGTVPGPPGIYCVSGETTVLMITNDMTAGDGYTFFALEGARIEVASNGTDVRFYWPSACPSPETGVVGERPTRRSLSFVCFDRRIVAYDPLTVLYSSHSTPWPGRCEDSAICIRGNGGAVTGDVFAPEPRRLAPPTSLTQGGGTVWLAGGGAQGGDGFIEAWQIVIQGNSGRYNGTGPLVGGDPIVLTQGELELGEGATCIFDPPVADPELYVDTDPPCFYPGEDATYGELVVETTYYEEHTAIVGADVGMDE